LAELATAVLLLVALAAAAPDDEVARAAARRVALDEGLDVFSGVGLESDSRAAGALGDCARGGEWARNLLGAACERTLHSFTPTTTLRPTASLVAGTADPVNAAGDASDQAMGARLGVRGAIYSGPVVARMNGMLGLDAAPGVEPVAVLPEAWVGYDTGKHWLGFGQQSRWMGPGQHGTLLLSDNATAPWMVNGGLDGHLPGVLGKGGRFRAELGVGVLQSPRDDVALPGLLMLDLRWMPHPVFEIGVNRLSIFGGEGRPEVDFGQLIVPSEPHVYDDPDKELPDQNELATVNLRGNLPLKEWLGGPFGHLSGWWEYGGEDMILRELGPIEYPALAGVANLYGGELAIGPVVATGEYARLMDDSFRWYVGHRVYHDGFTQDGRVTGHFGGPDSEVASASLAVWGERWRVRASGATVRRVAVVETQSGTVATLQSEEQQVRAGLAGDLLLGGGWLSGGYSAVAFTNKDFDAGNDPLEHRVVLTLSAGPELLRR
jgi:hypothetical protein